MKSKQFNYKNALKVMFKILLLIVSILTLTLFINSCSMIKKGSKVSEENLINYFITEDNNYSVKFRENKTGIFTDFKKNNLIRFDWKYNSGTALCSYYKNQNDNKIKELVFNFIDQKILYLRNYNLILVQYE